MASTDVQPIDTGWVRENPDAPSARFGWSGTAPGFWLVISILSTLILLGMLVGNHHGHIEDIYLIGIAIAFLATGVWQFVKNKKKWSAR